MAEEIEEVLPNAIKALERLKRACERGTGCRLTPDMCRELGLTLLANVFSEIEALKESQS